ncbi:hypothetical protein STEG23_027234, partial [Scotinomys teguina]
MTVLGSLKRVRGLVDEEILIVILPTFFYVYLSSSSPKKSPFSHFLSQINSIR